MCQRHVLLASIKGEVRQVHFCKWTISIEGCLEPLCLLVFAAFQHTPPYPTTLTARPDPMYTEVSICDVTPSTPVLLATSFGGLHQSQSHILGTFWPRRICCSNVSDVQHVPAHPRRRPFFFRFIRSVHGLPPWRTFYLGLSFCLFSLSLFVRDRSTSFHFQMVFAIYLEIIIPHLCVA